MKETKLEIALKCSDKILAKVGDFMANADLGIDGVYTKEVITFSTTTEVNEQYIKSLKQTLTTNLEDDGYRVYGIEVKVIH